MGDLKTQKGAMATFCSVSRAETRGQENRQAEMRTPRGCFYQAYRVIMPIFFNRRSYTYADIYAL